MRLLAAALLSSLLAVPAQAPPPPAPSDASWPQWLGPSRDGRSPSTGVFPASGPVRLKVAWRRPVGPGTSGLSVSGDRLVTLDSDEKGAWAVALSPRDGSVAWRVALDPGVPDEERGPGSTPVIAGGLAYALSPACQLRALDLATGKVAWHVDLKAQFGASPRQGCASSPLVEGERLFVQTGAPEDKRVAALDRATGSVAWAVKGAARANYSSPNLRGGSPSRELLINHTDTSKGEPRSGVSALRTADGELVWQYDLDKFWSFATPVPVGDDRSPAFTAYVAAPVYRDGYLYGHGGDFLRCLKASDGTTAWEERTYPGSVALVDGQIVSLSITAGLLRIVEANPQAYRERARLQVLEPGSRAETPPSVVGRRIFVRNDEEVVAVDVEG